MEKRGFFDLSDLKFVGWNIVFAALAGIAILVGLIYWLRGYTQHGVEVEVEDVRGLVVAEAEPILNAKGLRLVVVDSTYSDKVPFGTIRSSYLRHYQRYRQTSGSHARPS